MNWLRAILLQNSEASSQALIETLEPTQVADVLTRAGLEVEAMRSFGEAAKHVVVAYVRAIRPHPTKSGLQLVTVDIGAREQEVVCGASNVPLNGFVVFAPLGTHLPAVNLTIAPRTIAGVLSEGMLCSERELGLGFGEIKNTNTQEIKPVDAGILVLPNSIAKPGTSLNEAVGNVADVILELGVTPNRPDALGHVGVAREVAALMKIPFRISSMPSITIQSERTGSVHVAVDAQAHRRCTHYAAQVIENISIEPSSLSTRYRLHSLGVRSINNVVDVTNQIMLEYGHPLHAFDLDQLTDQSIYVRLAKEGESVITLDGLERTLTSDDLVICDGSQSKQGHRIVALAGVMGAQNSEISSTTKRILIECAYFDPRSIRRTARRYGLHSESSHRFERGVDSSGVHRVLTQASALMAKCGSHTKVSSIVEAKSQEPEVRSIKLRFARITQIVGMTIDRMEATKILQRLGCELHSTNEFETHVNIPTHRPDLTREIDLIEEIVRTLGYDAIPSELPLIRQSASYQPASIEHRARHVACELGLSEAINYAFSSPKDLAAIGAPVPVITLENPLGEERSVMRTSLLPGLLTNAARSQRHSEFKIRLFEVGARFLEGGPEVNHGLCDEVSTLALLLMGPRDVWLGRAESVDIYDLTGMISEFVQRLLRRTVQFVPFEAQQRPRLLHPRGACHVYVMDDQNQPIDMGHAGPLHPDVCEYFHIEGPAFVAELNLRTLAQMGELPLRFRPLATLPSSTRDVALLAPETMSAQTLANTLSKAAGDTCERIDLFDVYHGAGIPAGFRSIAFRLMYRDPSMTRTLTDAEIEAHHMRAIEAVQALGVTVRA